MEVTGGKAVGAWGWPLTPSNSEIKSGATPLFPLYAFMTGTEITSLSQRWAFESWLSPWRWRQNEALTTGTQHGHHGVWNTMLRAAQPVLCTEHRYSKSKNEMGLTCSMHICARETWRKDKWTNAGSCEYGDEPSGSAKKRGGTFLDKQPKCYEQIIPRGQRTARFYGVNDTVRVPSPSKA